MPLAFEQACATHHRSFASFCAADVNKHEKYGHQQGHPAWNFVNRDQESNERSYGQQAGWQVDVHKERGDASVQGKCEATQGVAFITVLFSKACVHKL